jgi:hypothetical protein
MTSGYLAATVTRVRISVHGKSTNDRLLFGRANRGLFEETNTF